MDLFDPVAKATIIFSAPRGPGSKLTATDYILKATRSADKICDEKVEEESNKSASNSTNICRRSLLPAPVPRSAAATRASPRLIPGTYKFYRISGKGAVNLRGGSFSRFRVSRGKNHRLATPRGAAQQTPPAVVGRITPTPVKQRQHGVKTKGS